MPEGTYTKEIHIPRETIWNFIKDMDHWAPLVPGYIAHHIRDEKQSTWKFNGDLSFIQNKIKLRIDNTEWTETKQKHIPRKTIWNFIKDMDHWAPLVPGYIAHHIRDEKQSTWKFNGDLGFIQKKIELRVDITEWKEPSLVTFQLKGLNEKF